MYFFLLLSTYKTTQSFPHNYEHTNLPASRSTWPCNAHAKLLQITSFTFPIIIMITTAHFHQGANIHCRPTILIFWMPGDEDYTLFVNPFPAHLWTLKNAHVLVPCLETRQQKQLINLKIRRRQHNQKLKLIMITPTGNGFPARFHRQQWQNDEKLIWEACDNNRHNK